MDHAILEWMAAHRSGALDQVMWWLTVIGRGGGVWLVIAALRSRFGRREAMAAWQVVAAVLLAWLITDGIVKPLVHRPRPEPIATLSVAVERPSTASFPSGHAAISVAAAWMLTAAWPSGAVAWWALAALISLSRVYLGVHYPSDVLGGILVGVFVGWFARGGTVWRFGADRTPERA
jgi:undecaprenyl-diphosphatase